MSDADRSTLEQRLRGYRAPEEGAAEERSLLLVRAAFEARDREARHGPRGLRLALASIVAAAVAAVALTPAGAAVRQLIEDAVTVEKIETPALRLPSEGSILTVNRDGAWIASAAGTRRFLGPYREATFSPRGLNVAVAAGRELSAVDQRGELQWRLRRQGPIADPAWAPSALRIAYRAGSQLRIVEGDGEPDRLLARRVAAVAPAWRPAQPGEPARDLLAYVDGKRAVRVADAVEGGPGLELQTEGKPELLEWLDNGRLVVAGSRSIELFAADGSRLARIAQPPSATLTALEAEPGAARVAVGSIRVGPEGARSEVALLRLEPGQIKARNVFSASGELAGLAFSPDGRWLGFGWPGADSWLFLRPLEQAKLLRGTKAVSPVSAQFEGDPQRSPGFPRILEWQLLG